MNKEIMNFITSSVPPHRGFAFKVHENDYGIWLGVSLETFAKYSATQQEDLSIWIGSLCSSIRKKGVPCYIYRKEDYFDKKGVKKQ